jgi:hypothetical protein
MQKNAEGNAGKSMEGGNGMKSSNRAESGTDKRLKTGSTSNDQSMQGENGTKRMKNGSRMEKNAQGNADQNMQGENGTKSSNRAESGTNKRLKTGSTSNENAQGGSQSTQGSNGTMKSGSATEERNGSNRAQNNAGANTSNETTSSTGNTNIKITDEQRTEIRQVITETHVQPVERPDFNITVGTSIPHTVHLHRLPPRIVELVPDYRDYEYFVLADGRIVIVDPNTYEIVYILTA